MKVTLRPLEEQDAYTSVKWRNIPEIWTHTGFEADREITIADELTWIRKVTQEPNSARFAIVADGRYIGNIYLLNLANGTGQYHIFIGERDYWGRGVARAASNEVIRIGRTELKLQAIELGVRPSNQMAIALYRSLGFVDDGQDGDFLRMRLYLQPS